MKKSEIKQLTKLLKKLYKYNKNTDCFEKYIESVQSDVRELLTE
jgi:hypothetical protein